MRKFTAWLQGYLRAEIVGASPQWSLNELTKHKIPFWNVCFRDEFTVELCFFAKDREKAMMLAEKNMCDFTALQQYGFSCLFRGFRKRPIFIGLLALTVILTVFLPQRIWFYTVDGNITVPDEKILRAVQESGVSFGTKGKTVVPQQVKDRVLAQIPELAWLTVTQNGMRAKIIVREKQTPEPIEERRYPRNMIAACDGVIENVSVLDGSPAVKAGDVVAEGQLLISAFVDLEHTVRVTAAQGEVYAKTQHEIQSVVPVFCKKETGAAKQKKIYYLQFGKRKIKISSGSGIFATECDKMTESKRMTLPGGLELPVSLVKETYTFYETAEVELTRREAEDLLLNFAKKRIQNSMVAGEILKVSHTTNNADGRYTIHCFLDCREMIGRYRDAEIFKKD